MLTATDPMDMTPDQRRGEIAAILAAGFLRLKCRPTAPLAPPATAPDVAMSPPAPSAARIPPAGREWTLSPGPGGGMVPPVECPPGGRARLAGPAL